MRIVHLAATAAFAVATAAHAGPMDSRFGNTVVSKNAAGVETKLYYQPDGTFTANSSDGQSSSGTWALNGNTVCLTMDAAPEGQPNPLCVPIEERAVGETWTVGEGSQQISITIVEGR